jgi:hypothetical protein
MSHIRIKSLVAACWAELCAMFLPCLTLRAAEKHVGFAECIQQDRVLALSQKQLSLQLDTHRLRDEASNLVQKRNKRVCAEEEVDGIDGIKGNVVLNKYTNEFVCNKISNTFYIFLHVANMSYIDLNFVSPLYVASQGTELKK